jgi:lysophospholipase L1-like esterase
MENKLESRRNFLRKAAISGFMAITIPEIVSASISGKGIKKNQLLKNNIILFQGDSITDAGRNKEENSFNNPKALGSGYAMLAAAQILEKHAGKEIKIFNKGISGNKVYQLAERWEKDCLEIKPDILSIMIGVNDFWHTLNNSYKGTVKSYKDDFIILLDRTRKALPDVKLIIGEPYAVAGVKAVDDKWFPEFYGYQKAAREVAELYGAIFIPFQQVFDEAQKLAPGIYWTPDGVHPSLAGAQLLAKAWLETLK